MECADQLISGETAALIARVERRSGSVDRFRRGDTQSVESPVRFCAELLVEQDRLRREATRLATSLGEGRSTAELETELAALTKLRNERTRSRAGYAMSKGGNNQGPAAGAWLRLRAQAAAGADLGWVNARISAIEDLLAKRRSKASVE